MENIKRKFSFVVEETKDGIGDSKSNQILINFVDIDLIDSAPEDWNFYKKLDDGKMIELIESITENGLLTPVIIWQKDHGRYMMLAGHNRLNAYKMLLKNTGNDIYKKIQAQIKQKNEIREEDARTIIIDTNFVQRQLSTIERAKSIIYKYNMLGRKKRNSGGKTHVELIADEYGLKKTQIFNYLKLKDLHPVFMDRIDTGFLSIKSGARLADLPMDVQEKLLDNQFLDNETIKKIKSQNYNEIISQIAKNNKNDDFEILTFKVPLDKIIEFEEFIHMWKYFNELEIIE